MSPVGDQGGDIANRCHGGWIPRHRWWNSDQPLLRVSAEAVNIAGQKIASGWDNMIVAGGIESMSRVPMGSDGAAWAMDPETAYDTYFVPQGISADLIATIEGFTREDVDAYAVRSQERAENAWKSGYFSNSVVPVLDRNGVTLLDHDEHMRPEPPWSRSVSWHHHSPESATWAVLTR